MIFRYLNWTLDDDKIRSQDSASVIEHIGLNEKGQMMAYKFTKDNWKTLLER